VLVDSEPISNGVLAEMLTEQGLATTLAEAKATHQGQRLEEVRATVEGRLGRALPDGWIEEYQRRRDAAFEAGLRAVPGARELAEAALAGGHAICVASQGSLQKTGRSLALTGLDGLFAGEARFSADQVPRGKPHPDLFLLAAAAMGSTPAACVVIEDTPSGVMAGARAGMRVLGYAAEADAAQLERAGAAMTVASLHDAFGALALPARG
jgi:HAD superfamily hydrolase (TIGR01509 family)